MNGAPDDLENTFVEGAPPVMCNDLGGCLDDTHLLDKSSVMEDNDTNEVTKHNCKNGGEEDAGSLDRWATLVGGQRKLTRGLSVILYKLQDMSGTHSD